MKKKLLPAGSLIVTKSGRILMVIGFYPGKVNEESNYKYICSQTSGFKKKHSELKYNQDYYYISDDDIEDILFIGYSDSEFDFHAKALKMFNRKIKSIRKEKGEVSNDDFQTLLDYCKEIIKKESSKSE